MIDKVFESAAAALRDVKDGATVMVGGFGTAGQPTELVDALIAHGARDLTIVNNNAGNGEVGLAALIKARRVKKIICSFPRQTDSYHFDAAGAGLGAIYSPTGFGTRLAEGKETRRIDGRDYVLEFPSHADFALIKAECGDRW